MTFSFTVFVFCLLLPVQWIDLLRCKCFRWNVLDNCKDMLQLISLSCLLVLSDETHLKCWRRSDVDCSCEVHSWITSPLFLLTPNHFILQNGTVHFWTSGTFCQGRRSIRLPSHNPTPLLDPGFKAMAFMATHSCLN